ncbi:MAG: TlpA family protein disulfide reductase [Puniceicoccaceae bacterium]
MPPIVRKLRIPTGWLAIPASLFLVAGCTTTEQPASTQPAPAAHHSAMASADPDSPFAKVFSGDADVVVLTFYDLYCVACQQSADNFSALHGRIQETFPDMATQVTGVGIGDTAFELSVFQRRYKLPYPSIPDPEKTFEEPFLIKGTPTVLVFTRKDTDCIEIYRHEGRFRSSDMEKLLETIREAVSAQ